jgi:hypothetical protein
VDSNLQQQANYLEDRITKLIRSMSASQAVILGLPISSGSPFYREIIVARGATPFPREKLIYNPASLSCAHVPNLAAPSTQEIYSQPSGLATLRNLYFFISEKNDGAPDASAITVVFQLDDNGMGHRTKTNSITRSFTATMRNN